jgi:hemerythrin-like domain-containing protein
MTFEDHSNVTAMSQTILNTLRFDHRLFAALLDAAAAQVAALNTGGHADLGLLKAIARYFEDYPQRHHHPFEEVIYGHLVTQMPTFADDVYGLVADHRDVADRARVFREATEQLQIGDPRSLQRYLPIARDFIEHERAHLTAEEQLFFPYAERLLTRQQWGEVARTGDHTEASRTLADALRLYPDFQQVLAQTVPDRSIQ